MSTNYPGAESGNKAGGVLAVVAAEVVAAFLLSWPYAFIAINIPHILANAALPLLMGWLIGRVAQAGLRKRHVHRPAPALIAGVLGGLFAAWFAWLAYLFVISGFNVLVYVRCLLNPRLLAANMELIANNPAWSFGVQGGSPAIYYTLWLLEVGAMVAVACYFCLVFVKRNKLCEQCNEWARETGDLARFLPGGVGARAAQASLAQGDLAPLKTLERVPPTETVPNWIEVRGYACPNCLREDGMVSTTLISMRYDKQSNRVIRKEKILSRFVPIDVRTEKEIFEPEQD